VAAATAAAAVVAMVMSALGAVGMEKPALVAREMAVGGLAMGKVAVVMVVARVVIRVAAVVARVAVSASDSTLPGNAAAQRVRCMTAQASCCQPRHPNGDCLPNGHTLAMVGPSSQTRCRWRQHRDWVWAAEPATTTGGVTMVEVAMAVELMAMVGRKQSTSHMCVGSWPRSKECCTSPGHGRTCTRHR